MLRKIAATAKIPGTKEKRNSNETVKKKSRTDKKKAKAEKKKAKKELKDKKKSEKRKNRERDYDRSDSSSDSSDGDDLELRPAAPVIPSEMMLKVIERRDLPGAVRRQRQPVGVAAGLMLEERPDLCTDTHFEPDEAEIFDRYARMKSELNPADSIYLEDNMDEDEHYFVRYEVNLKYNEGRYSSLYIVTKQQQLPDKNKPDDLGMFMLKTGLRKNSAAHVIRMKRELEVMTTLNKAKCVYCPAVVDSGKVADMPYTVMTLLDMNIEKVREENGGKFKMTTALHIAMEAFAAISDLHSKKFIHRDIKLSNLCVGLATPTSRVYLIDYGDTVKTGTKLKWGVADAATLPFRSLDGHRRLGAREKTDLESWIYVLLELVYPSVVSWKNIWTEDGVEQAKVRFWSELPKLAERRLSVVLEMIGSRQDFSKGDYSRIRDLLKETMDEQLHGAKFVPDWAAAGKKK